MSNDEFTQKEFGQISNIRDEFLERCPGFELQ